MNLPAFRLIKRDFGWIIFNEFSELHIFQISAELIINSSQINEIKVFHKCVEIWEPTRV